MKLIRILIFSNLLLFVLSSCSKDDEDLASSASINEVSNITDNEKLEVENFIYNGLNEIYLYKNDVPQLDDTYFNSTNEKNIFLESTSSPEVLFDNLTASFDRFSFITDDYNSLEKRFEGISGATGIKFGIGQISGTQNVFGLIRYILPNTSASEAGLKRGTIFTEINGQKLTSSNFSRLIDKENFTINIGHIENNQIILTEKTVTLDDEPYIENPVYISKIFNKSGNKIGYLMYNSFIANFDEDLNKAFGEFKANGVNNLILDLRYNGGGSVESAKALASMITGQFYDKVFIKERWNNKYQDFFENQDPEALINRFDNKLKNGSAINSLNLSKVYVLTSASSASASELIINGLDPYIDVIQIGDRTVGKFQASVTLYDSEDFSKDDASTNHTYATQPLVFKSINSAGRSDYVDGLLPDISYIENLNDFGVLGQENEPLLQKAINSILGKSEMNKTPVKRLDFFPLGESGMNTIEYQKMYINDLPQLRKN